MSLFYVERQGWQRWPKTLIVVKKNDHGDERRRYVPERTCRAIRHKNEFGHFDLHCSECHHLMMIQRDGSETMPNYCDECGCKVVE